MSDLVISQGIKTMSSREIAELCEKQHKHVIRDIENMLEALELGRSRFGLTYLDAQNKERKEYGLPKDLTLTLVSGYNMKLRKKIIDRWLELEQQNALQVPQTMAEALRLAADQAEQIEAQQKQISDMHPKVDAFDHFLDLGDGVNLQSAMKILGYKPNNGIKAMRCSGILFGNPATPYQKYINREYFVLKPVEDASGNVRTQTLVTPKGLNWLRGRLEIMMAA